MRWEEWIGAHPALADAVAALAGALLVLAFAPVGWWPLAVLSPAVLLLVWLSAPPRRSFWRGYLFGLAFFGLGISWVYNSIHEYGQAPAALAALITLVFVLFLALYPAFTGLLVNRVSAGWGRLVLVFAAIWTLMDWLRSWILGGFPWLLLGQAQVDTPLAGTIPVFGVFGATGATALTSGLLVAALLGTVQVRGLSLMGIVLVWTVAALLGQIPWSEPAGKPLKFSLIQGNVAQDLKWRPAQLQPTMDLYRDLTRQQWDSDLIIWPESAIPAFYTDIETPYLKALEEEARRHGARLVTGIFYYDPRTAQAYNSLALIDEAPQFYHKRHLVPFGEFMPLRGLLAWMEDMIEIPMSDLGAGEGRPVLSTDGWTAGVSICYEDAFGDEVIDALPEADLLINVSNDAWFGDSLAPHQHLQIARLRALETARFLLRATNTGISAVIGPRGEIIAQAPQFQTHVLTAQAVPRQGLTPFARWGNWGVVTLVLVLLTIIGVPVLQSQVRDGVKLSR